jgi:hypothetical protein
VVNGRVQTQDVEGTVEGVNATGLKIGGAWVNVSRFHPVVLPETGAHVRMKVDAKGYIAALENLSPAHTSTDLNERITRLAELKAGANFVGQFSQCHDGVKSEHVLVPATVPEDVEAERPHEAKASLQRAALALEAAASNWGDTAT